MGVEKDSVATLSELPSSSPPSAGPSAPFLMLLLELCMNERACVAENSSSECEGSHYSAVLPAPQCTLRPDALEDS